MIVDEKIRDNKLLCSFNIEAANVSSWSSGNIAKYECLTGEEIS